MRISQETLDNFSISYPLEKLAPLERILFLDIETTGFTAKSSYLYLIGCAYHQAGKWRTIQWLAEDYGQESAILKAFFEFAGSYKYLIHFNGNNFDLPFIEQKCRQLSLNHSFKELKGFDLYKRISPYKYFLKLPNCKQKTLERFLGINREDAFSGGELIGIYHEYVKSPNEYAQKALFLHNADDLRGMLEILPLLAYYDLLNGSPRAKKVQANSYRDVNGNRRKELMSMDEFREKASERETSCSSFSKRRRFCPASSIYSCASSMRECLMRLLMKPPPTISKMPQFLALSSFSCAFRRLERAASPA